MSKPIPIVVNRMFTGDKDYNYSVMRRQFERAIARATASKEEK